MSMRTDDAPFQGNARGDNLSSSAAGAAETGIGPAVSIKGEVRATEDLHIAGRVSGSITMPGWTITIGKHAIIQADVFAGAIIVAGTTSGTLKASSSVEIWDSASVEGHVVAPRISVAEGAQLKASFDTKGANAATRVAKYRLERADAPQPPDAPSGSS